MGCTQSTTTAAAAATTDTTSAINTTTDNAITHNNDCSSYYTTPVSVRGNSSKYAIVSNKLPLFNNLPEDIYYVILQYLPISDLKNQSFIIRTLGVTEIIWRERVANTFNLWSSVGYRKIGGIVVSNRTHTLSWKHLFKLRSAQPTALYLQFRMNANEFVVPIKRASQRPRSTSSQSAQDKEEDWFMQITSDRVMGGAAKQRRPPQQRGAINVLRTVARGRKRMRSSRHINHKLRVRRAGAAVTLMIVYLIVGCLLSMCTIGEASSNFQPISLLGNENTLFFGEELCVEDQISGAVMVSTTDATQTNKWAQERMAMSLLYDDNHDETAVKTGDKPKPIIRQANSNDVNAAADARFGTDEKHECKESTYGELTHGTIQMIVDHPSIQMQQKDSFLDLGSGRGATVLQVFLSKHVMLSAGVELSQFRHDQGCQALQRLDEKMRTDTMFHNNNLSSSISLSHDDMFEMNWSQFDVVYVSALCFRKSMMLEILRRLNNDLIEGTRVFSLRPFPLENNTDLDTGSGTLQLVSKVVGRASWGPTSIYIYKRVGGIKIKSRSRTNTGVGNSWIDGDSKSLCFSHLLHV